MANVLLINPSYQGSYGGAKASIVNPIMPTLGLATIAAVARGHGHKIKILDMSWRQYDYREIETELLGWKPDIVGITSTTPLMNQLRDISTGEGYLKPDSGGRRGRSSLRIAGGNTGGIAA